MEAFQKALRDLCQCRNTEATPQHYRAAWDPWLVIPSDKVRLPMDSCPSPLNYEEWLQANPNTVVRGMLDTIHGTWVSVDDKNEAFHLLTQQLLDHHEDPQVLNHLFAACYYILRVQLSQTGHDTGGGFGSTRATGTPQSSVPFFSPNTSFIVASPLPSSGSVATPSLIRAPSVNTPRAYPFTSPMLSSHRVSTPVFTGTPRTRVEHLSVLAKLMVELLVVDKPLLWVWILDFIAQLVVLLTNRDMNPSERLQALVPLNCVDFLEKAVHEITAKVPHHLVRPAHQWVVGSFQSTLDLLLNGRPHSKGAKDHAGMVENFPHTGLHERSPPAITFYDLYPLVTLLTEESSAGAKQIHPCLLTLVQCVIARRTRLARLVLPPDASEPVVLGLYRSHEFSLRQSHPAYRAFTQELQEYMEHGALTTVASQLDELLAQYARPSLIEGLLKCLGNPALASAMLSRAVFRHVWAVVEFIHAHSDFDQLKRESQAIVTQVANSEYVPIPENLWFWPLMTKLADLVYSLARANLLTFEQLMSETYRYFYPLDHEEVHLQYDQRASQLANRKDNAYLWVLLQLIYFDDERTATLREDFAKNEDNLAKLARMFNDQQALSVDGFYLRDMALQCIIIHHNSEILDRVNVRYRHPALAMTMPYFPHVMHIQTEVTAKLHAIKNSPDVESLLNCSLAESVKISLICYLRFKHSVPYLLWCVMPTQKPVYETACFPQVRYMAVGLLSQQMLEFLPPAFNDRLLKLLVGRIIDLGQQPDGQPSLCISPVALELIYRIVLVNPCIWDQILPDVFARLSGSDSLPIPQSTVDPATPSPAQEFGGPRPLSEDRVLLIHTFSQLLTYRLALNLRDQTRAYQMLSTLQVTLQRASRRQMHRSVESLVIQMMELQSDRRFVEWILSPTSPGNEDPKKPTFPTPRTWFAENDMLARRLVLTLARILKAKDPGQTISRATVYAFLDRCGGGSKLVWSRNTLAYFPATIRQYYLQGYKQAHTTTDRAQDSLETESSMEPPRPSTPVGLSTSPTEDQVTNLISENAIHNVLILGGAGPDSEKALADFYSCADNQPMFLCVLWTIAEVQKEVPVSIMPLVRRILLLFPPAHLASYTVALIDYILGKREEDSPSCTSEQLLEDFLWKYQILSFDHVVFALLRGHQGTITGGKARRILRHLVLESQLWQARVACWREQGFTNQPWKDDDVYGKISRYLTRFPEFYDYEAFHVASYQAMENMAPLVPPHNHPLPMYYETVILRWVATLDYLIGRCLELGDEGLLVDLLVTYGDLIRAHHRTPLKFVHDTLVYYYHAPLLRNPRVLRGLLHVLDLSQYRFTPALLTLVTADGFDVGSAVTPALVIEWIKQAVELTLPLSTDAEAYQSTLSQLSYQEYSSPMLFALMPWAVEVMVFSLALEHHSLGDVTATPSLSHHNPVLTLLTDAVTRFDILAVCPSVPGVRVLQLVAALFALLPAHAFTRPMVSYLVHSVKDPNLTEALQESSPTVTLTQFQSVDVATSSGSSSGQSFGDSIPDVSVTPFLDLPPLVQATFNPFYVNEANFFGNIPNTLLTFFHALVQYAGTEVYHYLHVALRNVRSAAVATAAAAVRSQLSSGGLLGGDGNIGAVPPSRSGDNTTSLGMATGGSGSGNGGGTGNSGGVARLSQPDVPYTPSPAVPATPSRILQTLAPSPYPFVSTPTPFLTHQSSSIRQVALGAGDDEENHMDSSLGKLPDEMIPAFDLVDEHYHVPVDAPVHEATTSPFVSDCQALYIFALVGPTLYRLDQEPELFQVLLMDLLWVLVEVCPVLPLYNQHSMLAIETMVDFLYHMRHHFHVDKPSLWKSMEPVINHLREPLLTRVLSLVVDPKETS